MYTMNDSSANVFILIDGSYFIYYRYFALVRWWKNAHPDEPLKDPFDHTPFVDKFISSFKSKMMEIPKKIKVRNPITIVAYDCRRNNIWRNEIFAQYKNSRADHPSVEKFFRLVQDMNLFQEAGANAIVQHPRLEADDCLAITVKHILKAYADSYIYIITSDTDYLQLLTDKANVFLYNLKFTKVNTSKTSTGDAQKDLFIKVLCGDKSDNIPPLFLRCGAITAEKYYENNELFEARLNIENARERYELNRKLISFQEIPQQYIDEFRSSQLLIQ